MSPSNTAIQSAESIQHKPTTQWRNPSIDQAISGFTAGAVSTAILHPLDLVKTRFQVNEKLKARLSLKGSLREITKNEGIRALYRGMSANMLGATMSWGMYFWWYANIKDWMRSDSPGSKTTKLAAPQHLAASASAGMLTCLFTNPLWLIKTRMCTQRASDLGAYRHVFDGLAQVVRHEGIAGLYRGIFPALIGVSHGAVQFMIYEELKHLRIEIVHNADIDKLGTLEYISMAAISKIFATVFTYPYQVVKSRMQVQPSYVNSQYSGTFGTIMQIVKNERMGGFYKGMGVNIVRVMPGTCITFAVYEGMSKFLRNSY
ncbi:hypothetical protein BDV3_003409 [Batrachochytrium dendrobatidis]|nr:mitochondrial FAD carrier protein flx1, variant 3 [Batrachochytrium dendrobatidis]